MPSSIKQTTIAAALLITLAGCQSTGPMDTAIPSQEESIFEPGTASARVSAQMRAEASALGAAQGAAAMAASFDPTGLSSIPLMIGNNAANEALRARSDALMEAAQEEDRQALYRYYGMNPDGTPSGKPGPGSAPDD